MAKTESDWGWRDRTGDTLGVIYGVDYWDSLNDLIGWRGHAWFDLVGMFDWIDRSTEVVVADWFVQISGTGDEAGPYRPSELLELVRNGEVTPESMLRKDNSSWFAAADVGGLFEAAMRPTIRHFCPNCQHEINEPPVTCPKCDTNVVRAQTEIIENSIASPHSQQQSDKTASSVKDWLSRKRLGRRSSGDPRNPR